MFEYRRNPVARDVRARTLAVACIAGGLLVTLTASAQAQFLSWLGFPPAYTEPQYAAISPAEIYHIVATHGYRVSGAPQRSGRTYLVDVVDSRGRTFHLVVDAYQGDILQRFATNPPRPPAAIPEPQSQANLYPQYPTYPDAAAPPPVTPSVGHKITKDTHRGTSKKTRTAARENGIATPTEPARPVHPARSEVPALQPAADGVVPQPAAKAEPTTAAVTPVPSAPSVAPNPPQPKTDGPGYANGVPINPLD